MVVDVAGRPSRALPRPPPPPPPLVHVAGHACLGPRFFGRAVREGGTGDGLNFKWRYLKHKWMHFSMSTHAIKCACSELESLDCLGDLPLLERLFLQNCKHLASLPGSHGNYTALRNLTVRYCPAINMKLLYGHFKRRLDSLEHKDLSDAGSSDPREGPKIWKPKSWKYAIPGR